MTKSLTTMIVAISIFLISGSYTGFEFGILVIGICLLFGILNLEFPVYPGSGYGKTEIFKYI